MIRQVCSFLNEESGATAVEYGLLTAALALAIVFGVADIGFKLNLMLGYAQSGFK
jgi:Flp pilus assembly pilin Flp